MTFEFASWVAVEYLAKRGVTLPCHPRQHLYTNAEDAELQAKYRAAGIATEGERVDMTADVETCTVGVTPDLDWYRTEPGYKWIYCRGIVHEFGHLAGLSHPTPETPGLAIMDIEQNAVPWGCDHPLKFRRAIRHQGRSGQGVSSSP